MYIPLLEYRRLNPISPDAHKTLAPTNPLKRRPVQQLASPAMAELGVEWLLARNLELDFPAEAGGVVARFEGWCGGVEGVGGTVHAVDVDLVFICG